MTRKRDKITLRNEVIQAAKSATVPVNDYDRAIILGQIAGLLAIHPKIGGKIAFKGGAIMHLIDDSPRLSRDLDGVMVAGGRIREEIVREALGTPEARKIVKEVGRFSTIGKDGVRFPVIVCHPLSGIGGVTVSLSIHWGYPLLLKPEEADVTVHGRHVTLLVVVALNDWQRRSGRSSTVASTAMRTTCTSSPRRGSARSRRRLCQIWLRGRCAKVRKSRQTSISTPDTSSIFRNWLRLGVRRVAWP